MNFIGIGYDIHKFKKGRKLYLGGVRIDYKLGLIGHSDADVVLHSICDALLGAAGLDDIGHHFPTSDVRYKNISSRILLKNTYAMIKNRGLKVINIDATIIADRPHLSPYIPKMKKVISGILKTRNVNIKSTTNEGIGLIGRGKAIASFSVALLGRRGGRVA